MGLRIAIIGWYGKANFGDELMASQLSELLSRNGNTVSIYSDLCADGVLNGTCDESYLDHDIIVIGGGGIVTTEFWALRESALTKLRDSCALIAFVNVNVTPDYINTPSFASELRSLNARWWVRDEDSVQLLDSIGIESSFVPDISFRSIASVSAEPIRPNTHREIGVFASHYTLEGLWKTDTNRFLTAVKNVRLLASYLDWMTTFGWHVTFWPAQTAFDVDDRVAAASIYALMTHKSNATWVTECLNWKRVVSAITTSDLIVSMRFHTTTTAIANGIPFVDISKHAKNRRIIAETGTSDMAVEFDHLSESALIKATQCAELMTNNTIMVDTYCAEAKTRWDEFDIAWDAFTENVNRHEAT